MKIVLALLMFHVIVSQNSTLSQDIINILGPGGVFKIKDGASDFFTLSQSTGQVNIINSLRLEQTINSTTGIIFKGTQSFIHNYGVSNTFTGSNSGNFTMTGGNNSGFGTFSLYYTSTGYQNSAFGSFSMYSNSSGYKNSAFGYSSLLQNTTGNSNSAFGINSLFSNTTGNENSAFGSDALYLNSTGSNNTAFGSRTLFKNTIGEKNTGIGELALHNNTNGNFNSASGYMSLFLNTTGDNNTALGDHSLYNNSSGNFNTAIGVLSLNTTTVGSNNIGIGYNVVVPNSVGSNQIRLGNTGITYAGIQVAWTITSDRRWKQNILSSNLGLGFIAKLNPVSYTRINDESGKTEYGLIAQDVEEVLKDEGVNNSGMLTVTDEGMYELRYNDLLAPMIKAIQELNAKCDSLQKENTVLTGKLNEVNELKENLIKLSMQVENLNSKTDELKSASVQSNIKENNLQVISHENTK